MEETLEKEILLSEVKDSDEGTVRLLNQNFKMNHFYEQLDDLNLLIINLLRLSISEILGFQKLK